MKTFIEHGDYEVCWQDSSLLVMPSGAFNEEGAINLNKHIEEAVEAGNHEHWYRIELIPCKDTMGTPEAEAHLLETFSHSRHHGCKMVLLVGGNVCVKTSIFNACQHAGLPVKHFGDLTDANAFINTP